MELVALAVWKQNIIECAADTRLNIRLIINMDIVDFYCTILCVCI